MRDFLSVFRVWMLKAFLPAVLICGGLIVATAPIRQAHAQAFSGSCASLRGSFTGTLTGYASPPTGTVQYRVTTNCQVTLWVTAAISGTSNAATMTMTGVPYNLWPNIGSVQLTTNIVTDNSASAAGCFSVPSQSGTLTFSNTGACAGAMTNTGTKGLPAGWTVTYTLY